MKTIHIYLGPLEEHLNKCKKCVCPNGPFCGEAKKLLEPISNQLLKTGLFKRLDEQTRTE
jgi:hypothetical protein